MEHMMEGRRNFLVEGSGEKKVGSTTAEDTPP